MNLQGSVSQAANRGLNETGTGGFSQNLALTIGVLFPI